MARKPTSSHRPVGLWLEGNLYTTDDIRKILRTANAGQLNDLDESVIDIARQRLDTAAAYYFYERSVRDAPASRDVVKKLESISSAAGRLLNAMGEVEQDGSCSIYPAIRTALAPHAEDEGRRRGGYDALPPFDWKIGDEAAVADYRGDIYLALAMSAVSDVKKFADAAIALPHAQSDEPPNPIQNLIDSILSVWTETLGMDRGTSVGSINSSTPSGATGPLIRFIEAAIGVLASRSDEDPRPRFDEQVPSPDAIRERIRNRKP